MRLLGTFSSQFGVEINGHLADVDPPGGGGVLWYFHTYVGSGHYLGFKILIFNIFWGFQKN